MDEGQHPENRGAGIRQRHQPAVDHRQHRSGEAACAKLPVSSATMSRHSPWSVPESTASPPCTSTTGIYHRPRSTMMQRWWKPFSEFGVRLVVLAGFMRIITPVLLDAFPSAVMNIHPALLPAFPGLHAQRQALGLRRQGGRLHRPFRRCRHRHRPDHRPGGGTGRRRGLQRPHSPRASLWKSTASIPRRSASSRQGG